MSSHPHSSDMMQWQWHRSVLSLLITWGWQALVHELSLGKAQPPLKTANKKGKCLNDKYLPDCNMTSSKSAFLQAYHDKSCSYFMQLWSWTVIENGTKCLDNNNYHYIMFRNNLFIFLLLHTETSCLVSVSSIAVNKTVLVPCWVRLSASQKSPVSIMCLL